MIRIPTYFSFFSRFARIKSEKSDPRKWNDKLHNLVIYLIYINQVFIYWLRNIRYPVLPKSYETSTIPLIIGGEIKVFLGANEHGYVFFWKGTKIIIKKTI